MSRLEGKVALVTGAAGKRGMGRACALRLAQDGADVIVNDVSQFGIRFTEDDRVEGSQGLKAVEAEIKSLGRKSLSIEADMGSRKQVEDMVSRCVKEFGKIDILVNNAGIIGPRKVPALEVSSEEEWQKVLAINVIGPYFCAKAVAKVMVERGKGGKIINFASVAGKVGHPGATPYTVSKFGMIGLTQNLALELGPYNINVNAVCPGFIATEILTGAPIRRYLREGTSLEEATRKAFANSLPLIPLGRAGQPGDVANVVAFLASPDSDYMTGQAINVTGGQMMIH